MICRVPCPKRPDCPCYREIHGLDAMSGDELEQFFREAGFSPREAAQKAAEMRKKQ